MGIEFPVCECMERVGDEQHLECRHDGQRMGRGLAEEGDDSLGRHGEDGHRSMGR